MKQQLLMYGKVARLPAGGLLRDSAFCPGTSLPVTDKYIRKRGRPCIEWVAEMTKVACRMTGAYLNINKIIVSEPEWRKLVDSL